MAILLPSPALVVLVGTTGAGKSTFANRNFRPTEVLSSDAFRALVADDERDQSATDDAFDALHFVATRRLASGRLTVIDATNVHPDSRAAWIALARRYRVPAIAVVLDTPPAICRQRNAARPERSVPPRVVAAQRSALLRSLGSLANEGFAEVWVLRGAEDVDAARIERLPAGDRSAAQR